MTTFQPETKAAFGSNIIPGGSGTRALAALMLLCSACAMRNPIVSSGPSPRVEDCMLLQQATPTKYVCGGKTYTSVQLADIRKGGSLETH